MKKILCVLICVAFTFGVVYAGESELKVYPTDIVAFVDGQTINSYNINGWTGIVTEDLLAYGFYVRWNPDERTLEVGDKDGILENASPHVPQGGEHKVYKTDIKTYVNGKKVDSFNIGGYTVIYIDELICYGDVVWNSEKRTISFTHRPPWQIKLTKSDHAPDNDCDGLFSSLKVNMQKDVNGEYRVDCTGTNHLSWMTLSYNKSLGGMRVGFSMDANHLLSDEPMVKFLREMLDTDYDGTTLKDNADLANERVKVSVNNTPVKIKAVTLEIGNNHRDFFFVLDCQMSAEEIESFEFELNK